MPCDHCRAKPPAFVVCCPKRKPVYKPRNYPKCSCQQKMAWLKGDAPYNPYTIQYPNAYGNSQGDIIPQYPQNAYGNVQYSQGDIIPQYPQNAYGNVQYSQGDSGF